MSKKPRGVKQAGLSGAQEEQLKRALRRSAPSEPWVEAQIRATVEVDPCGDLVSRRTHDPRVFPPGGSQTRMVRCSKCGIFNPPQTVEGGECLDHSDHEGWGPSPSAVAIRGLQHYHLRTVEIALEPESTEALQREIAAVAPPKAASMRAA